MTMSYTFFFTFSFTQSNILIRLVCQPEIPSLEFGKNVKFSTLLSHLTLSDLSPYCYSTSLLPFFHSYMYVHALSLHSFDTVLHPALLSVHSVTHLLILLPLSHPTPKSHTIPSPLSFFSSLIILSSLFYSILSPLLLTPFSQPISSHLNHHSRPVYPNYLLTTYQYLTPLSSRISSYLSCLSTHFSLNFLTPTKAILLFHSLTPLSYPSFPFLTTL